MVKKSRLVIPLERIESKIVVVHEQKVMLDSDLAELYGVTTSRLNEQVSRNIERFPDDFAFRLTKQEFESLISQNATSKSGHGGRRKQPRVFTEHGILMLSSVLRSKRAVQVNIAIMRTFVRMREMIMSHADLVRRIDAMESKYDRQFKVIFDAIRKLMEPPPLPKKRKIGFLRDEETD